MSKTAIASFICAFLCQPAGLILGIIALVKILGSRGQLGGLGFAIAGTAISACSTLLCIPIGAAIVIPSLMTTRSQALETRAAATLKMFASSQEIFRLDGCVDLDSDGDGEYGYIGELAGSVPCRGSGKRAKAASCEFGRTDSRGMVISMGYCYIVYLPGASGIGEDAGQASANASAANLQETGYVIYAWPVSRSTGRKMFAITQEGLIAQKAVSGVITAPNWDEAFIDSDGDGRIQIGVDSLGAPGWSMR